MGDDLESSPPGLVPPLWRLLRRDDLHGQKCFARCWCCWKTPKHVSHHGLVMYVVDCHYILFFYICGRLNHEIFCQDFLKLWTHWNPIAYKLDWYPLLYESRCFHQAQAIGVSMAYRQVGNGDFVQSSCHIYMKSICQMDSNGSYLVL